MIQLVCGRDLVALRIRNPEGWNITAFLDHLDSCEKCSQEKAALMDQLNMILSGKEPRE